MPKIDYVVANPPYGEKNLFKGSLDLHFRIIETIVYLTLARSMTTNTSL